MLWVCDAIDVLSSLLWFHREWWHWSCNFPVSADLRKCRPELWSQRGSPGWSATSHPCPGFWEIKWTGENLCFKEVSGRTCPCLLVWCDVYIFIIDLMFGILIWKSYLSIYLCNHMDFTIWGFLRGQTYAANDESYLHCRKRIKLFKELMMTRDVKELRQQLRALKDMNEGVDSEETSWVCFLKFRTRASGNYKWKVVGGTLEFFLWKEVARGRYLRINTIVQVESRQEKSKEGETVHKSTQG